MPYQIKEKKNKKFSVVNKDTGKVMSKSTTESKAKKQIKAIYANMKPEHRLRHRIGMMDGLGIHNPVHRGVINEVKKLLKHEEIYGNGFWDFLKPLNFLDEEQYPKLNFFLKGVAKTNFISESVKKFGMLALTVIAEPWLAPFAVADAIANSEEDYVEPSQQSTSNTISNAIANGTSNINNEEEEEFEEDEEEEEEEINKDLKKEMKKEENVAEKLDKLVEHIQTQNNHHEYIDDAIRFPEVYDYDPNNKPMQLQAWLLSNGVGGKNFSINEFGNTYKNQQPYAFLDFPINGGRLGKIDYSSVGYSKF
jgi:hypothetical protein